MEPTRYICRSPRGAEGAEGVCQPPRPPQSWGKIPSSSSGCDANQGPLRKPMVQLHSKPLLGHPGITQTRRVLQSQGRILVTQGGLGQEMKWLVHFPAQWGRAL